MLHSGSSCALIISTHNAIIYEKCKGSGLFSPIDLTSITESLKRQSDMGDTTYTSPNILSTFQKIFRLTRRNLQLVFNTSAECQVTLTK